MLRVLKKTIVRFFKKTKDRLSRTIDNGGERYFPGGWGGTGACVALMAITLALSGCALQDKAYALYHSVIGTETVVEQEITPIIPAYDSIIGQVMTIVRKSQRCGRLEIPNGTGPTIKIGEYRLTGGMSFQSSLGSGKISETEDEREYMILTLSATFNVYDSACSHGYKDVRWNKAHAAGEKLIAVCIVMLRDNRHAIEEYSDVLVIDADAWQQFLVDSGVMV